MANKPNKLYFVAPETDHDPIGDGTNIDGFVWAGDPQQAADLWAEGYELEDLEQPVRVFELPMKAPGTAAVLDWDSMKETKVTPRWASPPELG